MSKYMLSDQNAINAINPFVMIDFSLPGTSARPYKFSEYSKPVQEKSMFDEEEESITCQMHPTGGWRAANFCQNPKPNCPMSRRILPERIIQYEDGRVNTELYTQSEKDNVVRKNNKVFIISLLIALIVLFLLRR